MQAGFVSDRSAPLERPVRELGEEDEQPSDYRRPPVDRVLAMEGHRVGGAEPHDGPRDRRGPARDEGERQRSEARGRGQCGDPEDDLRVDPEQRPGNEQSRAEKRARRGRYPRTRPA